MLPVISTRVHGFLDYVIAAYLLFFPWIYGFYNYTWGPWIMMITGLTIAIYSIITRYELGYAGLISIRMHLWFDFIAGLFLAASPWLLHFSEVVYVPHLIGGIALIILSVFTRARARHSPNPKLSPRSPAAPPERIG